MTLRVNIVALYADAARWLEAAEVTKFAAAAAKDLELTDWQLGSVTRQLGFSDKYEQVRRVMEQRLGEATKGYESLAKLLQQLAKDFESDDKAAATRLRGVWDPVK